MKQTNSSKFVTEFNKKASQIYANSQLKGFWDGNRNFGEAIALIHSELSEALEADRASPITATMDEHISEFTSVEVELADAIIRIMDLAYGHDLNVAGALEAKVEFNRSRPYKHGKQY